MRPMTTKREVVQENERLRERLEEAYDVIGDALEVEDDEESENVESEAEEE